MCIYIYMYIVQRTERETVYLLIYIRFARNAKFICSGTRSNHLFLINSILLWIIRPSFYLYYWIGYPTKFWDVDDSPSYLPARQILVTWNFDTISGKRFVLFFQKKSWYAYILYIYYCLDITIESSTRKFMSTWYEKSDIRKLLIQFSSQALWIL